MSGNGPLCPIDPRHGRLMSVDRGGDPSKGWRCPHSAHGGNGRPFTNQQIQEGVALTEGDVMTIYETAAADVVAGKTTLDAAAAQVAKTQKVGTDKARARLQEVIGILQDRAAAKQAEHQAIKAKTRVADRKPQGERVKLAHVEPADFAAVRDALGMSNKDTSLALAAAGMGSTLSRVTELTHSKGSSDRLFAQFKAALEAWRAANPAE